MNLGYIKQATVGTPTIRSGGRPLRAQPAPQAPRRRRSESDGRNPDHQVGRPHPHSNPGRAKLVVRRSGAAPMLPTTNARLRLRFLLARNLWRRPDPTSARWTDRSTPTWRSWAPVTPGCGPRTTCSRPTRRCASSSSSATSRVSEHPAETARGAPPVSTSLCTDSPSSTAARRLKRFTGQCSMRSMRSAESPPPRKWTSTGGGRVS